MMSDETKKLILENPRHDLIKEYENVSALFPGLKLTETDAILSALPSSVYSTKKKMPCYCHEKKRGIREFEELKRNRFKADSMLDVTVNQLDCCLACVKLSLRTPILRTQISNMILARDVSGPEKSDNPGPKFATKNVGEHL
jgi:hypothetical protein